MTSSPLIVDIERGSEPGLPQCLHRDGLAFILIPKNGTNTIHAFLDSQFTLAPLAKTLPLYSNLQIVSIIRDPIDRWISGTAEFAHPRLDRNKKFGTFDMTDSTLVDMLFSTIVFDHHTVPQSEFLKEDCTLFPFPDFDGVFDWFETHGFSGSRTHKNETHGNHQRGRINQILRDFLQTHPKYQSCLRDFYDHDFLLYKKAIGRIK